MYKFSIISDEISKKLIESIDFALLNKIDYIELRSVGGVNIIKNEISQILFFYKQIFNSGLKCFCYPSPLLKWDMDFNNEKALIQKVFEISNVLDSKYIRIFSYLKSQDFSYPRFAESLDKLNDLAKKNDKYLLLENEPVCNLQTFQDLSFFFNKYKFSRILPLPDLGNETEINSSYSVKDFIKIIPISPCIHIKDYSRSKSSYVIVGKGDSYIKESLSLLENQDINPVLTLETHVSVDRKNVSQLSLEAIKKMVIF